MLRERRSHPWSQAGCSRELEKAPFHGIKHPQVGKDRRSPREGVKHPQSSQRSAPVTVSHRRGRLEMEKELPRGKRRVKGARGPPHCRGSSSGHCRASHHVCPGSLWFPITGTPVAPSPPAGSRAGPALGWDLGAVGPDVLIGDRQVGGSHARGVLRGQDVGSA